MDDPHALLRRADVQTVTGMVDLAREARADYTALTADEAMLLEHYRHLPLGWQYYLSHKARQLCAVAQAMPAFLRSSLQAIPPESSYWEWERSLDEYLHQQNGQVLVQAALSALLLAGQILKTRTGK